MEKEKYIKLLFKINFLHISIKSYTSFWSHQGPDFGGACNLNLTASSTISRCFAKRKKNGMPLPPLVPDAYRCTALPWRHADIFGKRKQ